MDNEHSRRARVYNGLSLAACAIPILVGAITAKHGRAFSNMALVPAGGLALLIASDFRQSAFREQSIANNINADAIRVRRGR